MYIPMFAIHNILPSNEDVAKCMESLMKYQSLANNMFISEHAVCLSQAHDKEQQILEQAKQSCCQQLHFEMDFRELENK